MRKIVASALFVCGAYWALAQSSYVHTYKINTVQYVEYGIASWYGPRFYGKRTSDGTKLRRNSRWIAHKTLPLGTRVRITDIKTGRSVEAQVKDRGPFIEDRIVDLTEALAHELGIHERGLANVRLEVIKAPFT